MIILKNKKIYLLIVLLWVAVVPNVTVAIDAYGPIKTGDILWNIAAKVRSDPSISRYQTMIALLKANPNAFHVSCNLNTLKIGQMLHIPLSTAMQVLSRVEAVREFRRQQKEWKIHRQQKQTIVCAQQPELPTTISQPITQPATIKPITVIPVKEPSITFSSQNQSTTTIEKTALPLVVSIWNDALAWFSTQPPLLLVVSFLLAIILLLLFLLIGRKSHRYASEAITTKKPSIQPETISQNGYHVKSNNKGFSFASATNNANPTPTTTHKESLYAEMKEKLDHVKAYLAGNDAQTTQRILREVIQKGTSEQKDEAKQLYEINKRMDFLKQFDQEKKPYQAFSATTNNPIWSKAQHLQSQQQYLPENQEKVFELVDKIFELLDHDSNAQGKSFNAYLERQQSSETQNYEILDKATKLVDDEDDINLTETTRPEPKPTRFL